VKERTETALIFEDDADWDVNIKSQLVEFARGTRYLQGSADNGLHSPYGDDWDMLWFGHCGISNYPLESGKYFVIRDDPTVSPIRRRYHGSRQPNLSPDALGGVFRGANFTRYVYSPTYGLCAIGYAVSLRGAEKLLYNFSIQPSAPVWDRAISKLCDKHDLGGLAGNCYAPWPTMFSSFRPPGNTSRDSDRTDRAHTTFRNYSRTGELVYPLRINFDRYITRQDMIPSQWPEETLWPEISRLNWTSPEGTRVYIDREDFKYMNGSKIIWQ